MMNCPKLQFVEEYLRGETPPRERAEFEGHLSVCPRCQQALAREKRFDEMLCRQPLWAAPDGLRERVMTRLEPQRAFFSRADRLWVIGFSLVVAAVGSIIGYGGGGFINAIYSRVAQWFAHAGITGPAGGSLPAMGSEWLGQLTAGNSIMLLNFLVGGIVLCWGLWQMVKVLRR